ncbi:hypothetical protein SYNPS1DRAFT_31406, partial [Syncephalis pseudoplumigaleata]
MYMCVDVEIRQLDSDMKSLVYENYGKFISATDTMRQMKDRLVLMREQLGELNQRVERANKTDKQVGADLAEDQRRIAALDREHHTLSELGVLFELPSQLLSHLAHDHLADAVRAFRHAAPLLDQFRNEPGYEGIESESREIMAKVAQQLQKNLHSERADCAAIADATGLLIGTESIDVEELHRQFVTRTTWRLEQVCERLREVTARKGGYLDKHGATLVMDAMASIHTTLLAELDLAVACYEECFLSTASGSTPQLPSHAHPTCDAAHVADHYRCGAGMDDAYYRTIHGTCTRGARTAPDMNKEGEQPANAFDTVVAYETALMETLVDRVLPLLHVGLRLTVAITALIGHGELWRHQLEKSSQLVGIVQTSLRRFWMSLLDAFLVGVAALHLRATRNPYYIMTVQDMSRSHRLTYARTHTLIIAANLCMDFEAATVGSVFDAFGQQLSPGFSSDDFDRWWDRGGNGPDVA